jgi:2-dehydro-3-deoxyphosphogluconate aldolase / (4S)-4-hydroxy-2-oxoglutarate aldolase
METQLATAPQLKSAVLASLTQAPIIGVVRTGSMDEARASAHRLIDGGIQLVEITFTVPGAPALVRELRRKVGDGPPWIGVGTTTTPERAALGVEAGAAFFVTPNVSAGVASVVRRSGALLVMGALTASEIVQAHELGADLVKVFPLAPVGGPRYLEIVRGPLADIPMLAAGGFLPEEIPAYRKAGAIAFGVAATLLTDIPRALAWARGEERS